MREGTPGEARGGHGGRPGYGAPCRQTRPAPLPETRTAGRRPREGGWEPRCGRAARALQAGAAAAARESRFPEGTGGRAGAQPGPDRSGLRCRWEPELGGLYGTGQSSGEVRELKGCGASPAASLLRPAWFSGASVCYGARQRAARNVAQAEVQPPGSSEGGREAVRCFSACERLNLRPRDGRLLGGAGNRAEVASSSPRSSLGLKRKAAERKRLHLKSGQAGQSALLHEEAG